MPTYSVRFKGLLFQIHRSRLEMAGIAVKSSKPGMQIGLIMTGQSIHTASVEADSVEDALAMAMEALAPEDVNFTGWEAGPI